MGNWSHNENSERGLANELSRYIYNLENDSKIHLPNLRHSNNLYIFSDYSNNKDQQLISYSLLLIDEMSFQLFEGLQKNFWKQYFPDQRIIDYKGLNDKIQGKALVPFLQLCNNLNGLIITILFHRNTKSIFQNQVPDNLRGQIEIWKNKMVREKFLRLREFILLILNGLGTNLQNVLWVTDNDEIIANSLQITTAKNILNETLIKYLDFKIYGFDLKTPDIDLTDRCLEKLCSLADLTAGALVDFLGDYHKENITPGEGEIAKPIAHEKLKVNPITNWLSKNEKENLLKKITIKIIETDKGDLRAEYYRFPEIK